MSPDSLFDRHGCRWARPWLLITLAALVTVFGPSAQTYREDERINDSGKLYWVNKSLTACPVSWELPTLF